MWALRLLLGASLVARGLADAVGPAPTVALSPTVVLPMVALGTGSGQKGDVANATALWLGATAGIAIDTSIVYENEGAIARGAAAVGAARVDVFLETKIVCRDDGTDDPAPRSYAAARAQVREESVGARRTARENIRGSRFVTEESGAVAAPRAKGLTRRARNSKSLEGSRFVEEGSGAVAAPHREGTHSPRAKRKDRREPAAARHELRRPHTDPLAVELQRGRARRDLARARGRAARNERDARDRRLELPRGRPRRA